MKSLAPADRKMMQRPRRTNCYLIEEYYPIEWNSMSSLQPAIHIAMASTLIATKLRTRGACHDLPRVKCLRIRRAKVAPLKGGPFKFICSRLHLIQLRERSQASSAFGISRRSAKFVYLTSLKWEKQCFHSKLFF